MPSGPGAAKVWREAYAVAKRKGYKDFKAGTPGRKYVQRIAEMIAAKDNKH